MSNPSTIMVASIDAGWRQYDGTVDGRLVTGKGTKFHRSKTGDDEGRAHCNPNILLNDDYVPAFGDCLSPNRDDVCQRCVPRYVGLLS